MLFQRQVRIALVEDIVFEDKVGFVESLFDVAKSQRDFLMYVSFVGVVVDLWLRRCKRVTDTRDRR